MRDARQVAHEVVEAMGTTATPVVAFVDEDGSFWPPAITATHVVGGRPFVPFVDWQNAVGLLEAALRRERKLLQGARA